MQSNSYRICFFFLFFSKWWGEGTKEGLRLDGMNNCTQQCNVDVFYLLDPSSISI